MLHRLFAPTTPAEIERRERDQVAARKPHLALVGKDPKPEPSHFVWRAPGDPFPQIGEEG